LINCRQGGSDLLDQVTSFVNTLLAGLCPPEVAKIFFGGRLLAFDKPGGDVRPIVIGFTLRRLASKLANAFGIKKSASYLRPRQLGAGMAGGIEAAIHAARRFLDQAGDDEIMVKIDFRNAFNSLHRKQMLETVDQLVPEISHFVRSGYSSTSALRFGQFTLDSAEGVQQGDPLGPLLFCLTIQPILSSLSSNLAIGYLDDLTLAGSQEVVASDVEHIEEACAELGLSINASKSEVIITSQITLRDSFISSFLRIDRSEARLLGVPLFDGVSLEDEWRDRCADMARAASRLKDICSQDALILLRASLGAPKVQHLLRGSYGFDHVGLGQFDELQREVLSTITNSSLSDTQWAQANLPIKEGGLGIRNVSDLALPAFIASSLGTGELQEELLRQCQIPLDPRLAHATSCWESRFGPAPVGISATRQASWVAPITEASKLGITTKLTSTRDKAIFLAAQAPNSGAWMSALPIAACGLKLDNEAIRVAVALRLGLSICLPHACRCGVAVDAFGSHAFVCKKSPGINARHAAINDIVARGFSSAGVPTTREPSGLLGSSLLKPDGVSLIPWRDGKPIAWDATIATTLADSHVSTSATAAGSAAELAASKKVTKYAGLGRGMIFQPISLESLESASEGTASFVTLLGKRISAVSGDPAEPAYLRQRLSICLTRYNAVLLHYSFVEQDRDWDE